MNDGLQLYPHQKAGAEWLATRPRAALYDDQGLGKTITAIAATNCVRRQRREARPFRRPWRVLVCCPSVVLWNWQREWQLWSEAPDRVQVVSSLSDDIDPDVEVVVVTHRALIEPRIHEQLVANRWDLVILDEAHFMRNRSAQRTVAFFGDYRLGTAGSIVACSDRAWVLTGTPAPNDVRNLWTTCWGLWPERFPAPSNPDRAMTYGEFQTRYAVLKMGLYQPKVVANRNVSELRERLQDVTLRRRKSDHLDLPALRYEMLALRPDKLPTELAALDAQLDENVKRAVREYETPEAAFGALASALPADQISTWRRLSGLAKVEPIAELLTGELEADLGLKIVVFAHHTQVVEALVDAIGSNRCVRITGDVPAKKRQERVDRFQLDPRIQVAVCQIVAGGTGITLTEATEVVLAESSWVPGENAQAVDRIHRIGQDRPCRVRFVALAATCDELIVDTLKRKTRLIREFIE